MPRLKPVTVGEIIFTKFCNLCNVLQFISVVFRKCIRMGSLKYCNASVDNNVYCGTCDLYRINRWRSIEPGASSCKYLGIIIRSDLDWADHINCTLRKAWKALHFLTRVLKGGNSNARPSAYTALVRPILEYGAVCWDPYREGQVSALNRVQKRAAKFANNMSRAGKFWYSVD